MRTELGISLKATEDAKKLTAIERLAEERQDALEQLAIAGAGCAGALEAYLSGDHTEAGAKAIRRWDLARERCKELNL